MKRTSSYRDDLVQAIREFVPAQCFSQWRLRSGLLWTPQRIFWIAIVLCWSAEQTLADGFDEAVELLHTLFPAWRLGTSYTGWVQAQERWLKPLRSAMAERLRREMQRRAGRFWTREGWCAFAADGSRFECPRTLANETALGCAGRERTAPQLFLTTLWHMGLGLPWDFRIGPGKASERRHLEAMLKALPAKALIVADAGFTGYRLYTRILKAKRSFLLRVGSNVHLLRKLGMAQREGPSTVYVWPDAQRRRPPVKLRLLTLRRKKQTIYLVTNEEKETLPERTAALLYELRWGVEVFFRSCKQTLEKRKMRSQTADTAKSELTWAIFGLWLLGLMSASGMVALGQDPLRWSVAQARRRIRHALRQARSGRRLRRGEGLLVTLAAARQDEYQRHRPKAARNYPRKKQEKPPGAPKIRVATPQQRKAAKHFAVDLRLKRLAA